MFRSEATRTTTHRAPGAQVTGLLIAIAVMVAAYGHQLVSTSPSTAASAVDVAGSEHTGLPSSTAPSRPAVPGGERPGVPLSSGAAPFDSPPGEHRDRSGGQGGALGEADGAIPDGTTVFDAEVPGVANLDPALLLSLRHASTDAATDGIEILVNSGWRSAAYQEQLFLEAVSEYGSEREAARWVATAETSQHVTGHAVDVGHADARAWLSDHGERYGLCQVYDNEPWHYELRPDAVDHGCPARYADPTQDPRMQN